MSVLNQGETLEEEEANYSEDALAEGEAANNGGGGDKKKMDPKRLGIIGAAAVLVIVVLMFMLRKDKGDTPDDPGWDQTANEVQVNEDGEIVIGSEDYDETPVDDTASATPSEVINYAGVDLIYSSDEVEQLRSLGYTGDEIESSSEMGIDYYTLYDTAYNSKAQKEAEIIKEQGRRGSAAYKEITRNTFLVNKLANYDWNKVNDFPDTYTHKEVVDYQKLPARGRQLFIQAKMTKGPYVFFMIDPYRYAQLPDSGNIVIEVEEVKVGKKTVIVNVQEVPQE